MKLSYLKLAYAVKCGAREENFLKSLQYDMDMDMDYPAKITITDIKTGERTMANFANVIWWQPKVWVDPKPKTPEPKKPAAAKKAPATKAK